MFFTHPMFEDSINVNEHIRRVAKAALDTGVTRLVYNTSSWVPDQPCGQIAYDTNLERENIFAASGVPLTVIRPVLFMDNLLTNWVKPGLVKDSIYRYPHGPTMGANWISLDDVARFMIGSLDREDTLGDRIVIGGPETLLPSEVAEVLSKSLGKPIHYEYITPRQFGEVMYDLFGAVSPLDRNTYAAAMDDFYTFMNDMDGRQFQVNMAPVLERMPLKLTTLAEWAEQQDWSLRNDGPSGG